MPRLKLCRSPPAFFACFRKTRTLHLLAQFRFLLRGPDIKDLDGDGVAHGGVEGLIVIDVGDGVRQVDLRVFGRELDWQVVRLVSRLLIEGVAD